MVTVGAARRPLHARVDLPEEPALVTEQARYLADVARRYEPEGIAVLVYSSRADLARHAAAALAVALGSDGPELVCAVRADGQHWWVLREDGDDDEVGTPYDVRSHPWLAQAVFDGTVVHGSRDELAASLLGHDEQERADIDRLAVQAVARLGARRAGPLARTAQQPPRSRLVEEGVWVRERVRRWLEDPTPLTPPDVARLAVALVLSPEVRDVAWAEMTHENAVQHVELWTDLTRRVPTELRAPVASLLGFAAWINGNGALAWCALDRATAAEPAYGLAGLLGDVLNAGMSPSAWEPFPREALTLFAG